MSFYSFLSSESLFFESCNKICRLNSTARYSGAVGDNTVIPRLLPHFIDRRMRVLDYGAGKKAIHTKKLRAKGYNVIPYDIGENRHNNDALNNKYDCVFLSNVINIQESKHDIRQILKQVKLLLKKPNGFLLLNYPSDPRRLNIGIEEIKVILRNTLGEKVYPVSPNVFLYLRG